MDCAAAGGHDKLIELLIDADAEINPCIHKYKVSTSNSFINHPTWEYYTPHHGLPIHVYSPRRFLYI